MLPDKTKFYRLANAPGCWVVLTATPQTVTLMDNVRTRRKLEISLDDFMSEGREYDRPVYDPNDLMAFWP